MNLFDVKRRDGELIEGLTRHDVVELARSGRLTADSLIRREGQEGWRLVKSVPEFAVHIGVGASWPVLGEISSQSGSDGSLTRHRTRWMVAWFVGVVLIIFYVTLLKILYTLDGSVENPTRETAPEPVGEEPPAIVDGGESTLSNVDIADLIDNTSSYKGANIRLKLTVGSSIHQNRGDSLRNYVGSQVQFYAFGKKGERLDIAIVIPEALSVPKVGYGDHVVVTFNCSRGDLQWGNIATVIERP